MSFKLNLDFFGYTDEDKFSNDLRSFFRTPDAEDSTVGLEEYCEVANIFVDSLSDLTFNDVPFDKSFMSDVDFTLEIPTNNVAEFLFLSRYYIPRSHNEFGRLHFNIAAGLISMLDLDVDTKDTLFYLYKTHVCSIVKYGPIGIERVLPALASLITKPEHEMVMHKFLHQLRSVSDVLGIDIDYAIRKKWIVESPYTGDPSRRMEVLETPLDDIDHKDAVKFFWKLLRHLTIYGYGRVKIFNRETDWLDTYLTDDTSSSDMFKPAQLNIVD